ncbi:MAG: (Fe-S)-binding protein [Vicinamibacteria bacterium]
MSKGTALFVTCLVDEFFPEVGEASLNCLDRVGCRPEFPEAQTCCGQPAFNMGYQQETRRLARRFIEIFEPYDAIIAPSGSCTSMVRVFYPELFESEPEWKTRAESLASRVFELTEFLAKEGFRSPGARGSNSPTRVTYHDSCHLLRELGVHTQPRQLLQGVDGLELVELEGANVCCGFGGTFSVKMSELSEAILNDKLRALEASGADVLTATDAGCLMHLDGALKRRKSRLRAVHVARVLAGDGAEE